MGWETDVLTSGSWVSEKACVMYTLRCKGVSIAAEISFSRSRLLKPSKSGELSTGEWVYEVGAFSDDHQAC